MYDLGDAFQSAHLNSLVRRKNGVRDFNPAQDGYGEGPCAVTVGSSASGVEVDIDGGTVQVDGSPVTIGRTKETLSDNTTAPPGYDEPQPRNDLIIATDDGIVDSVMGAPDTNRTGGIETDADTGEPELAWQFPEGSQATQPEPPSGQQFAGVLLATVYVPPGATVSQDLTDVDSGAIHDLRKPALREPDQPWENPNINAEIINMEGKEDPEVGTYRDWNIHLPEGHALTLYMVGQHTFRSGWSTDWEIEIEFFENLHNEGSGRDNFLTTADSYMASDPIERVEAPFGQGDRLFGLRQIHNGEPDDSITSELDGVGFEASYRVEELE